MPEYICGYTKEDVRRYLFEQKVPLSEDVVSGFCERVRESFQEMRKGGPAVHFDKVLEDMEAEGLAPRTTKWQSIDGHLRWMRQTEGLWFELVGVAALDGANDGVVIKTACNLGPEGIAKGDLERVLQKNEPCMPLYDEGLVWLATRNGSNAFYGEPDYPYAALARIVLDDNIASDRFQFVPVEDWHTEGLGLAIDIMEGRKDIVHGSQGETERFKVVDLEGAPAAIGVER